MKKIIYSIFSLLVFVGISSCSDWTDQHAKDYNELGKSQSYYAALRAYKASDHAVAFGWYGGWSGEGASLNTSLMGLPDSMDMVSIWGDWKTVSPQMRKDLDDVRKLKGLKVMACSFTKNVGDNMTPAEHLDTDGTKTKQNAYWGWDPTATGLNVDPTAEQEAAIRKYAKAFADTIIALDYDGFDMDHEPNYGGSGNLASSKPRLKVFFDEMSKYFGPKSNSDRILAIDGQPAALAPESGPLFDWFIIQAYDCTSYTNLNTGANRLGVTIANYTTTMTPEEVAKKLIMTENFENQTYCLFGGARFVASPGDTIPSLEGMARWEPEYGGQVLPRKGGVGTYHVEYEYTIAGKEGTYPATRNAIQIMNPAGGN